MNLQTTTDHERLNNASRHWYPMLPASGARKLMMIWVSCLVAVQWAAAAETGSFSEPNVEVDGARAASASVASRDGVLEMQLSLAQESIKTLTSSLATANKEADLYRHKYSQLQSRTEALGLESLSRDQAKLEQRLLNAVSDLRVMQKERDSYRDHMLGLSEATIHLLKTSTGGDALARMEVEAQLRAADKLATSSQDAGGENATLLDARVVSVKEEWSLVVGNIGEKQGVRVGMPLRVIRDDKLVAMLKVIDVRQKICGAIVQELDSGRINVGDRLQADLR